jgi:hypothetical protein
MKIYMITWVQGGCFGLSAVVIAPDEGAALHELKLGEDDTEIDVCLIGNEIEPSTKPWVAAHESL